MSRSQARYLGQDKSRVDYSFGQSRALADSEVGVHEHELGTDDEAALIGRRHRNLACPHVKFIGCEERSLHRRGSLRRSGVSETDG